MRKPTRSPPPPPPPPRCRSPARSCYSLPRQAGSYAGLSLTGSGSEYADSVCSMPTRLIQTPMRQYISPATSNYHSCRSETAYSLDLNTSYNYCTSCYTTSCSCSESCFDCRCSCAHTPHHTPIPPYNVQCSSCLTPTTRSQIARCHSPCASAHSHQSHHNLSNNPSNNNHGHVFSPIQQVARPVQPKPVHPTPRARTRTRYLSSISNSNSISPMPEVENLSHLNNYKDTKPHHYRLHVEKHVEKVFKYLKDREQRRAEILKVLPTEEDHAKTFLDLFYRQESQNLRLLRARIRKDNFREVAKLGSGFIGTVFLVEDKSASASANEPGDLPLDGPANAPLDANGQATLPLYAMKKLKISQVVEQKHLAHVMAERDILAEANSEWIVKLHYSFQDSDFLYFIMDYIPGGDMMTLLMKQRVFPEDWARFYIAEISLAVQFVHDMGFIHRDIKPDNILIDRDGHIKLTDFGLCTGNRWTHDSRYYDSAHNTMIQYNDTRPSDDRNNGFEEHPTITKALTKREILHSSHARVLSFVGSPNYIAPEVLPNYSFQPEKVNQRLRDWWSVGVILYEMVVGYCPFINIDMLKQGKYDSRCDGPYDIQKRIVNWREHLAFPSNDPKDPPQLPDDDDNYHEIRESTKNLIRGLLCDPQDRLCQNGICDIKGHPFFLGKPFCPELGIDWDNIRTCLAPYVPELKDERDTSHFDQSFQPPEPAVQRDNGAPNGRPRVPINDFTYRSYVKR